MKTAQLIKRYQVRPLPSGQRWGVYDLRWGGFCTLPASDAKSPALLALEWPASEGAETWLYLCRVAWGSELIEAPDGWNGT